MTERTLSDSDVKAIAEAVVPLLKKSILSDMQTEAGKGLLTLAKKAVFYIILLLALYAISRDFSLFKPVKQEAEVRRQSSVAPFKVLPPRDNPELTELAERVDRKMGVR